jgi:hypothetical protein
MNRSRRTPVAFYRFPRPHTVLVRDDLLHQLLVQGFLSEGSRIPAWSLRPRLTTAAPSLPTGASRLATAVVAPGIRVLIFRRSPVPSLAPFFGSSALRSTAVTAASSLLRPLMTSSALSRGRPPQVRCGICPPVPSGSRLMRLDDLWASLFLARLAARIRPPCRFLFVRSEVCYALLSASPRGYALRFATVAVIGSDWLLSSNKILPMLGTRSLTA